MKVGDQESLIEEVIGFAREKLKSSQDLGVTVVAIDERGHKLLLDVDPRSFVSGETKNRFADAMRDEFRRKNIIRYAFIAESWLTRQAPPPAGPVTRDYLDRHMANYHADYAARGVSPHHGGGREEILLLHVCDRMKSQVRFWSIARDPQSGFVTKLTPIEDMGTAEVTGRFANLLEGQAN